MTDESSDSIDETAPRERHEVRRVRREGRREERQERLDEREEHLATADAPVGSEMSGADAAASAMEAGAIDMDLAASFKDVEPASFKDVEPASFKDVEPDGWKVDRLDDTVTGVSGGRSVPGGGEATTGLEWDSLADDLTGRPDVGLPVVLGDKSVGAEFIADDDASGFKSLDTAESYKDVEPDGWKVDRLDDTVTGVSGGGSVPGGGEATTGLEWDSLADDLTGRPDVGLPVVLGDKSVGAEFIADDDASGFKSLDTAESYKDVEPDGFDIAEPAVTAPVDLGWQDLADPLEADPIDFADDFDANPVLELHVDVDADTLLGDGDGFDVDG